MWSLSEGPKWYIDPISVEGFGALIMLSKKHLLNKTQVAELLGFKIYTIDAWVSQRRIPYIKLGRLVRFNPDEIEKWIEEKRIEPTFTPLQVKNLDKTGVMN